MPLHWQLSAFVLAAAMNIAAAAISCDTSYYGAVVGNDVSIEGMCTWPKGGWRSIRFSNGGLSYYGAEPIVGTSTLNIVTNESVKLSSTVRGFDNMIGEKGVVIQNFSQEIVVITRTGNITERGFFNFTVRMARSSPNAAALQAPAKIPVGCLVEGVEARVLVNFSAPNTSASYQKIRGDWKQGDVLPFVLSRPSSARRWNSRGTSSYDAGSQRILRKIEAAPDGDKTSLQLVLKPPTSQTTQSLRGNDGVSWEVCIIPGDGYNYYDELCTERFPVKSSQAECDSTPPDTSGVAPLTTPVANLLALAIFIITLLGAAPQ